MDKVLKVKDLAYGFGSNILFSGVNFVLERGDYCTIIGPNGSGKSSLLKLLLGILSPISGTIELFGKQVNEFNEWHKIGYVPQSVYISDVFLPITVKEFLELDAGTDVAYYLNYFGLEGFLNKRMSLLSFGLQQRAWLIKAFAKNPELLILDEPINGLDPQTYHKVNELLNDLNRNKHITIVHVSHDIGMVSSLANKLLCMNNRRVYQHEVSEIVNPQDFECFFGNQQLFIPHHDH